ncbi:MAG: GTPase HflX [Clostridia bacterium]|nr:GTPase HflX [Clostridia bacterium]
MFEIHGNTDGIRQSELTRLQALYLAELDSETFLTDELAETLASATAKLNREIALYISRNGEIIDVVIGDNDTVSLPEYRMRRNQTNLSRVRVIHTHPSGTAKLSAIDMTALTSLRLDAISALGITDTGIINGISAAFITGWDFGTPQIEETEILPISKLSRLNWMQKIRECEENLSTVRVSEQNHPERAILIAIRDDSSFNELDSLARTAGAVPVARLLQKRPSPDSATYIGTGKVKELALAAQTVNADLIIAQDELSGIQIHQLESITGVRVIDRTNLILDIFAQRARTREGQLQVSLAQLSYQMSHLVGFGLSLSRLGGGIGTRGPGETKLEMDRRAIKRRRTQLRDQLDSLKKQRSLQKKRRERNEIPTAALVGYTNAGKSTIFNALTQADVYVENQLFATLDATTRRIEPDGAAPFLLTDTVGFISNLPTELIEAFQSTLEEAVNADLLLIVSDASNPDALEQLRVVDETLRKLGAERKPVIEVLNKSDIAAPESLLSFPDAVVVSAKTGDGMDELKNEIISHLGGVLCPVQFRIPYNAMQLTAMVHECGQNVTIDYKPNEAVIFAELDQTSLNRIIKAGNGQLSYEILNSEDNRSVKPLEE